MSMAVTSFSYTGGTGNLLGLYAVSAVIMSPWGCGRCRDNAQYDTGKRHVVVLTPDAT
jgi:hypothetical protein